jgi:CDP-diacylglycerol--glycerol-3-phosphate 3-phosphatidyltransferase
MAVLAISMLITYERARAESLGFSARGGLMERAERLILLAAALLFHIVVPILWVMLGLTALTAVHRFVMVWRQASAPPPADAPRRPFAHERLRVITRSRAWRTERRHRARTENSDRRTRPRRLSRVPGRR